MLQVLILFICVFTNVFSNTPSVLIIGAGPSGIAAATKLLENGITNITILEAENRIGGRIYSVPIEDGYVDIGAEFCHGQEGNVVYEKVKNLDLLQHSNINIENLYYSNGSKINPKLANEIASVIENYDEIVDSTNTELTVGEHFMKVYNSTLIEKYKNDEKNLKIVIDGIRYAEHGILTYEGTFSWDHPSAGRHFVNCEGDFDMQWKTGGFHTILNVLMRSIPNPKDKLPIDDKIKLNKQVSKIKWSGKKAEIKTSDNSTYTADHVIFTPSVGVLKNKTAMFDPLLPKKKLNAIDSIGLEAIIKVLLHFPQKWWDENLYFLIWSAEDIAKSAKEFPRGYNKDGVSWVTNIWVLTQAANPKVLTAWISGSMVPEIEQIPEEIVKEGVLFVINKFLGNRYNISKPNVIIRSQWYSNPNFLGTYSFEKHGHFNNNISQNAVLAEPLLNDDGEPVVQFAGEATNPIHYATVHGAIETGWREAERIINLHKP